MTTNSRLKLYSFIILVYISLAFISNALYLSYVGQAGSNVYIFLPIVMVVMGVLVFGKESIPPLFVGSLISEQIHPILHAPLAHDFIPEGLIPIITSLTLVLFSYITVSYLQKKMRLGKDLENCTLPKILVINTITCAFVAIPLSILDVHGLKCMPLIFLGFVVGSSLMYFVMCNYRKAILQFMRKIGD